MVKLCRSELNTKKSMPAGTLFFNVRYLIYLHNIIFVFKLMYRNRLRKIIPLKYTAAHICKHVHLLSCLDSLCDYGHIHSVGESFEQKAKLEF